MKVKFYFIPLTMINSKLIKDLIMRSENIKLLDESIEKKLLDFGLGKHFFASDTNTTSNKKEGLHREILKFYTTQ